MPSGGGLVHRSFPWGAVTGMRWAGSATGCAVALAATWRYSAGKGVLDDQIVALAVGVTLLVVVGCSHASMVLQGRRAVGARRARLLADSVATIAATATRRPAEDPGSTLLAVRGLGRFHRPECPMLDGREAVEASEASHRASGRTPCGVCGPRGTALRHDDPTQLLEVT